MSMDGQMCARRACAVRPENAPSGVFWGPACRARSDAQFGKIASKVGFVSLFIVSIAFNAQDEESEERRIDVSFLLSSLSWEAKMKVSVEHTSQNAHTLTRWRLASCLLRRCCSQLWSTDTSVVHRKSLVKIDKVPHRRFPFPLELRVPICYSCPENVLRIKIIGQVMTSPTRALSNSNFTHNVLKSH